MRLSVSTFLLVPSVVVLSECVFDSPRTDGINWAYNRGGCFICEDSVEGEWLTDEALQQACEQTCAADGNCVAYEFSHTPLDAFSSFRGSGKCCLSYDQADASSPVYVQRGTANNCQKEANCWSRVEKDMDQVCDATTNAETYPQCRQIYEWMDGDLDFQIDLVNQGCPAPDDLDDVVYQSLLDTASASCQANDDDNTDARPQGGECTFGDPVSGEGLYGLNLGGCFACENRNGDLLYGQALQVACEQTCLADPNCASYEIAKAPIEPLYTYGYLIINCCVEHTPATSDNPYFVSAAEGANPCQKETSCWDRIDKVQSQGCSVAEPNPLCRLTNGPTTENNPDLPDQIREGCPGFFNDTVGMALLNSASSECRALAEQSSGLAAVPLSSIFRVALLTFGLVFL